MFAGLDTENYDRQYGDRELMGRMLSYFRAHRRTAFLDDSPDLWLGLAQYNSAIFGRSSRSADW